MWGEGELAPSGQCHDLEMTVVAQHQEFTDGLENARLKQERRALRLEPRFFQMQLAGNTASINFELPPGAYATAVLNELIETR